MNDRALQQILTHQHEQAATVAALRNEVARLRQRRTRRRLLPFFFATLLVALAPLTALAVNPFGDLNPGSPHNGNIDAIYGAGVTTGCDPNVAYCPNGNVTREEMASFLARTAGLGANKPVTNAARLALANPAAGGPTYAANEIVRASWAGRATPLALTTNAATPQTVIDRTIVAPAAGFVIVSASATFRRSASTGTCPCNVGIDVAHVNEPGSRSYGAEGTIITDFDNERTGLTTTSAFAVQGGTQTFRLRARQFTAGQIVGTGPIEAALGEITVLYVPFGSTGGSTYEAGVNAAP